MQKNFEETYSSFEEFFRRATGGMEPYPYQNKFANEKEIYNVIKIGTGMGKTATVVLGWLWRRLYNDETKNETPRRLIYCLPMRVLVEQVYGEVSKWLKNLNLNDGLNKHSEKTQNEHVSITMLMGGEDTNTNLWDLYPEENSIIIGTQDMLLSRALNRGYAMSRYRWPIDFGILNNDVLWVYDEIQLMGSGFYTGIQLHSFRNKYGTFGPSKSIWMSATLEKDWIKTVDFDKDQDIKVLQLSEEDYEHERIRKVKDAKRKIKKIDVKTAHQLAQKVYGEHEAKTVSIIIVNTVERSKEVFSELKKIREIEKNGDLEVVLLHSHFRQEERVHIVEKILSKHYENMIIVSTQVIEAGVDISSKKLFTEVCPASSFIQRAGRCNRWGEFNDGAEVIVVYFESKDAKNQPYNLEDINNFKNQLENVIKEKEYFNSNDFTSENPHKDGKISIIRQKDVLELFSTDSDLMGGDTDISRFIRDGRDTDVVVFWREIPEDFGTNMQFQMSLNKPSRREICSAPIGSVKEVVKEYDAKKGKKILVFDWVESRWVEVNKNSYIYPGQILVFDPSLGHYDIEKGWDINSKEKVSIVENPDSQMENNYKKSVLTDSPWKSIKEHSEDVLKESVRILQDLHISQNERKEIQDAITWHDSGKAHPSFQARIDQSERPESITKDQVAKAPERYWKNIFDRNVTKSLRVPFRHEIVSAILSIKNNNSDLVSYLVLAHHGKVRYFIRSNPNETNPCKSKGKFAMGVCDGDIVGKIELPNNINVDESKMDLSIMELGEKGNGESWVKRVNNLIKMYGIYKLAYMECIVRSADQRASGGFI